MWGPTKGVRICCITTLESRNFDEVNAFYPHRRNEEFLCKNSCSSISAKRAIITYAFLPLTYAKIHVQKLPHLCSGLLTSQNYRSVKTIVTGSKGLKAMWPVVDIVVPHCLTSANFWGETMALSLSTQASEWHPYLTPWLAPVLPKPLLDKRSRHEFSAAFLLLIPQQRYTGPVSSRPRTHLSRQSWFFLSRYLAFSSLKQYASTSLTAYFTKYKFDTLKRLPQMVPILQQTGN